MNEVNPNLLTQKNRQDICEKMAPDCDVNDIENVQDYMDWMAPSEKNESLIYEVAGYNKEIKLT